MGSERRSALAHAPSFLHAVLAKGRGQSARSTCQGRESPTSPSPTIASRIHQDRPRGPKFTIKTGTMPGLLVGARADRLGRSLLAHFRSADAHITTLDATARVYLEINYYGVAVPVDDRADMCWIYTNAAARDRPFSNAERRQVDGGFNGMRGPSDTCPAPATWQSNLYGPQGEEGPTRFTDRRSETGRRDPPTAWADPGIARGEHLGPTTVGVVEFRAPAGRARGARQTARTNAAQTPTDSLRAGGWVATDKILDAVMDPAFRPSQRRMWQALRTG